MTDFKIKHFTDDLIILVREKEHVPKIQGLPPTSSQCILMNPDELELLLKVLQDYANERRNTTIQFDN
jgi:hypothetical protein